MMTIADILFKLMPRFKVRAEGDLVRMEDQVHFESIKMPSRYLNVSALKFSSGPESGAHELDLALNPSAFSLVSYYVPNDAEANLLKVRYSPCFLILSHALISRFPGWRRHLSFAQGA